MGYTLASDAQHGGSTSKLLSYQDASYRLAELRKEADELNRRFDQELVALLSAKLRASS